MADNYSISWLDPRNQDTKLVQGDLASWINQFLPKFTPGQPYTGQLSAPMSTYQNQGMGFLQQFLDQSAQPDANPLLSSASKELTDTMSGSYDPSTSPFFKATRDAAAVQQQSGQNQLNAQLGARGKFFSSEALNENQQLQTNTTNFLDQTLASMGQQERQNRLTAAGMAPTLDKAQTTAKLAPVAAATTYGAVPQELQQADLERQYQAFLNQRKEQALPVTAASGWSSPNMLSVGNQPKPSFDWESFLGTLGGAVVGGYLGGPVGATAGASIGGSIF